jgi:hypothetical protein
MVVASPVRNLVLVHTPERQALEDWLEIQRKIRARAPEIDVRIASNVGRDVATPRWQSARPSLVFSADRLLRYRPAGGTVYAGRYADKAEQVARLAQAGVPVPPTVELARGLSLDEATWGPYVVLKPIHGSRGRGIRLLRTVEVADRYAELSANGTHRMIVQRYVEPPDERPAEYRVLTMLGRALCCSLGTWLNVRAPLARIAADPAGLIASNAETESRTRRVVNEADVIAIGERAHKAYPGVGVLGVDLVRENSTGAVYALECNPVGSTWHFSSALSKAKFPAEFVKDLYAQFGALDLAAELLVERTRAEAS